MSCGYILPIRITGQAEDAISKARPAAAHEHSEQWQAEQDRPHMAVPLSF
jgi:hypothetical protein